MKMIKFSKWSIDVFPVPADCPETLTNILVAFYAQSLALCYRIILLTLMFHFCLLFGTFIFSIVSNLIPAIN